METHDSAMSDDDLLRAAEELSIDLSGVGLSFCDHIISIANFRVVTAADFKPFIGQSQWLTIDANDLPMVDGIEAVDAICKFTVDYIDIKRDTVAILVNMGDKRQSVVRLSLPADELAIRMEDA